MGLQYARQFNPYGKNVSMDELLQIRRQLAKVLNQRMVRLENTKSPITGEAYTFGAYDLMQDYLTDHGKTGDKKRFTEKLNVNIGKDPEKIMDKAAIQKEIREMQGFEDMISSRISGMHAIENQRVKTFETSVEDGRAALSHETVTNKEFYDFLNSATYEELSKSLDSNDIVELYDRASGEGLSQDEITKAIITYSKRARKISVKGLERSLHRKALKKRKKR